MGACLARRGSITLLHPPEGWLPMTNTPGTARVLVVDDDRALRYALSALLEEAGYRVAQAASGPEALASLKTEPADLMLLDVGLPGMGGLDVLAETRKLPAPPSVVMMTADDNQ